MCEGRLIGEKYVFRAVLGNRVSTSASHRARGLTHPTKGHSAHGSHVVIDA